jgi:hypothetical protein
MHCVIQPGGGRGLDLEAEHPAVGGFGDEVDLVTASSTSTTSSAPAATTS